MSSFSIEPVRERLREYLSSQDLNNRSFERKCGLYNGFVKDMDTKITFDSLFKIGTACPNLNLGWLFSGVGSMLIGETAPKSVVPGVNVENVQSVFITNWGDIRAVVEDAVKSSLKNK